MKLYCNQCKSPFLAEKAEGMDHASCPGCHAEVKWPDRPVGPGIVVGDFLIERSLSKGGMGEVFVARQLSLDREVALKVLQEKFVNDKEYVDSLFHEARAAAKVNHPNIVQAYAVGEENGVFYFAMELIRGETFKQILKRDHVIDFPLAVKVICEVAQALDAAWREQKLVHQDIKPDNIMLDSNGFAKLADLGLARTASVNDVDSTSNEVLGTPQYISPEQLTGVPTDCRSDIYSLGATFFQFVTGRFPYVSDSAEEIAKMHVAGNLTPPKEFNPALPDELNRIIVKMMARDIGQRYQTPAELIADLEAYQHQAEVAAATVNAPGAKTLLSIPKAGTGAGPGARPLAAPPVPGLKPGTPALKPFTPGVKPGLGKPAAPAIKPGLGKPAAPAIKPGLGKPAAPAAKPPVPAKPVAPVAKPVAAAATAAPLKAVVVASSGQPVVRLKGPDEPPVALSTASAAELVTPGTPKQEPSAKDDGEISFKGKSRTEQKRAEAEAKKQEVEEKTEKKATATRTRKIVFFAVGGILLLLGLVIGSLTTVYVLHKKEKLPAKLRPFGDKLTTMVASGTAKFKSAAPAPTATVAAPEKTDDEIPPEPTVETRPEYISAIEELIDLYRRNPDSPAEFLAKADRFLSGDSYPRTEEEAQAILRLVTVYGPPDERLRFAPAREEARKRHLAEIEKRTQEQEMLRKRQSERAEMEKRSAAEEKQRAAEGQAFREQQIREEQERIRTLQTTLAEHSLELARALLLTGRDVDPQALDRAMKKADALVIPAACDTKEERAMLQKFRLFRKELVPELAKFRKITAALKNIRTQTISLQLPGTKRRRGPLVEVIGWNLDETIRYRTVEGETGTFRLSDDPPTRERFLKTLERNRSLTDLRFFYAVAIGDFGNDTLRRAPNAFWKSALPLFAKL